MKDLKEIEQRLRSGRLPDANLTKHRPKIWNRIIQSRRGRRKTISIFSLPPYIWALASIAILVIFFILMFYLKK